MKDKTARALAVVALVFMAIFVGTLIATLVDYTLLGGGIGFIALGAGVFAIMIFIALKADGRGYSITKMNNEMEMEKIQNALKEQVERENAQKAKEAGADESEKETEEAGEENPTP